MPDVGFVYHVLGFCHLRYHRASRHAALVMVFFLGGGGGGLLTSMGSGGVCHVFHQGYSILRCSVSAPAKLGFLLTFLSSFSTERWVSGSGGIPPLK